MDPEHIPTGIPHVWPELFQQILDKVKNHGSEHLMDYEPFFLIGNKNKLYFPWKTMSPANLLVSNYLSKFEVDERYNQESSYLSNMFGVNKLEAALKSLEEEYYPLGEDYCRLIHRGHVTGISLSQPLSLEGAGNSSTSGYAPGTNACGEGAPVGITLAKNNGDPSSSVKHSPPGKGKVPPEEGAGGFANVRGDAISSMNAPHGEDLEKGLVNDNGDPPAPRVVPSSVVHCADHSADVAMTMFQVSAAAYRTAISKFAQASHTTSLAMSMAANLLADTNWKAANPILAKAGTVACGVGVLADIGKDLPLPLFMGAISAGLLIITIAMVLAKRPA